MKNLYDQEGNLIGFLGWNNKVIDLNDKKRNLIKFILISNKKIEDLEKENYSLKEKLKDEINHLLNIKENGLNELTQIQEGCLKFPDNLINYKECLICYRKIENEFMDICNLCLKKDNNA